MSREPIWGTLEQILLTTTWRPQAEVAIYPPVVGRGSKQLLAGTPLQGPTDESRKSAALFVGEVRHQRLCAARTSARPGLLDVDELAENDPLRAQTDRPVRTK